MQLHSKIWVAGHTGLVGSALVQALGRRGFSNLIYRTHAELDLLDQGAVRNFYRTQAPEYVFVAAAKVGGIIRNQRFQADFLYENLAIATHMIQGALGS